MHRTILLCHSVTRWALLFTCVLAIARALSGVRTGRTFDTVDERGGFLLVLLSDLQLVFGLVLYFVTSPIMEIARASMKNAMKEPSLRFYAVEHVTVMVLALVLVHVGRVLVRRAEGDAKKHRRALLCFGLAGVCFVLGTPWPFLPYGRPLMPAW